MIENLTLKKESAVDRRVNSREGLPAVITNPYWLAKHLREAKAFSVFERLCLVGERDFLLSQSNYNRGVFLRTTSSASNNFEGLM